MRSGFDLKKLINDLLALVLHACDSEHGSICPVASWTTMISRFCPSADFVSQALQEAEDITMIEGEES
jgi:hypothetical protein